MADNHAILLTPPGPGAIAVVRVVGPGIGDFLEKHFSKEAAGGRPVHGDVVDGGRVIDDAVVVMGPMWADLNVHGGPWVVQSVLDLARRNGFEVVNSSQLPETAHDGETLIEGEMLAALPLARTELALRTLLAQPAAWAALKQELAALDESRRQERIGKVLADRSLENLLSLPRVAIVGIPNVGKSTLANQLFAQERSITADLPGTTRDWVGEIANLDGLAVMLIDTPGQRQTMDPIEHSAISQSMTVIRGADLVVVVLDATQPLGAQEGLLRVHPSALVVVNKSDRPAEWDVARFPLHTVATTGDGVDELRGAIRRHFGCENIAPNQPRAWTQWQRAWLAKQSPGCTSGAP